MTLLQMMVSDWSVTMRYYFFDDRARQEIHVNNSIFPKFPVLYIQVRRVHGAGRHAPSAIYNCECVHIYKGNTRENV